jgi:hypothetical protein
MYWGEGSGLGLLTLFGYLLFILGAALVWRGRDEISLWIQDQACEVRRSLSPFTAVGPFYGPRPDSRLKAVPATFLSTIRRAPRSAVTGGLILAFVGPLLVFLDFFM